MIKYTDRVLQEDAERLARCALPFDRLRGVTVLVTGATGLIGSTLVKSLAYLNSAGIIDAKLLCVVRSREKAEQILSQAMDGADVELVVQDVTQPIAYDGPIDYIVHGASVTSSKLFVNAPIETISTAIDGTRNLLELAAAKKVKGFVYLSSMEVYGVFDGPDALRTEKEYGLIDPLDVRSSYSESKRMVECLCRAFEAERGVPVTIARLVQTFGPGVDKADNRVFAQFARSVINGEDIVLHTKGETKRKYLYTGDAVQAVLLLLLKGRPGEAYNIAHPDSYISIYEMASLVAGLDGSGRVKVKVELADIGKFGYAPTLLMNLSTEKIESLGFEPAVCLKDAFVRMIRSMTARK